MFWLVSFLVRGRGRAWPGSVTLRELSLLAEPRFPCVETRRAHALLGRAVGRMYRRMCPRLCPAHGGCNTQERLQLLVLYTKSLSAREI